ncbi:MAG TPA: DUF6335 family protein [Thermoanaerobaculia bacterium]|nr:DUF6335 family protein [Thermoanaerobaculia bacterium]
MRKTLHSDPTTVSVDEIADNGELLEELDEMREHDRSQSPELSAGDVDARWDQAESGGEETAGGSSPTPDQDVVDEIGKAIGVTYQEGEPLRAGGKEEDRDKHRWELDPASAEDYRERLHEEVEADPVLKMEHQHHQKKPS